VDDKRRKAAFDRNQNLWDSFPAGVVRMDFWKFNLYTFLGSFPWCLGLAYAGYKMGEHWPTLRVYFHRFDYLIGVLLAVGVAAYIWLHLKQRSREADENIPVG